MKFKELLLYICLGSILLMIAVAIQRYLGSSRAKRLSIIVHIRVKVLIELENTDILQICVTVIVGALIFLTLATQQFTSKEAIYSMFTVLFFGLGIMIFFSYPALKAINGVKDHALKRMRRGFIFIFVMAIIFVIEDFLVIPMP